LIVNIEEWRNRIDEIDRELVDLLNKRAELAVKVGEEKRRTETVVYDPEREEEILRRVARLNSGPLSDAALDSIYRQVFAGCTEVQSGDSSQETGDEA